MSTTGDVRTATHRHLLAIETRVRWLRWFKDRGQGLLITYGADKWIGAYGEALEHGETFYMEDRFCALVEQARTTIPDDLAFESKWLVVPRGWIWLETPFPMPQVYPQAIGAEFDVPVRVHGVGWRALDSGQVQIVSYQDAADHHLTEGFVPWSCFLISDGDVLSARIASFEEAARQLEGGYLPGRDADLMHEIRWAYAAFHLMAQKLATTVRYNMDRAARRRTPTSQPFIHAITLRRLQQARDAAPHAAEDVEWRWQWIVSGHWRNQWFPSESRHRQIFIDSYVKGPDDKPLKPETARLYVARR